MVILLGRGNKKYYKNMHQQAYERLHNMQAFGESKKEAIADGTNAQKIFSYNTYQSYWKHIKYFIAYVKEKHPECTTIKKARKYVNEWLQVRCEQGLSAWTVQLEAKALGKLYGITPDDENYFNPPKRNREDIKRSRSDCVRDKHFSVTNNDELIKFCKGTGLRRSELSTLKGGDLVSKEAIEKEIAHLEAIPEQERTQAESKRMGILQDTRLFDSRYYIHVRNGKGGRERISPIIGKNAVQIVERIQNTPQDEKVWQHVHQCADTVAIIHHGKMMKEIRMQDIEEMNLNYVELSVTDEKRAAYVLTEKLGLQNFKILDSGKIRIYDHAASTQQLTKILALNDVEVVSIGKKSETLEDYFLKLTGEVKYHA